jgi:tetrapyrrole methylase family protein/MazG family protein
MTHSAGVLFDQLLEIMQQLRGPGGCPWDREQTRASLKPYLIEEAYEVLDAIEAGGAEGLREELGDLLFQVVFHAQIAAELEEFTMATVLQAVIDKMVARHPHVFGDARIATPAEALSQWEALKQREAERGGRPRSLLDGVPRALPSLLRAQRLQSKAARVGFDWPDAAAAWAKVEEEVGEVATVVARGPRERLQDELGDLLFALVNVARLASIDADEALHGAVEKFRRRFTAMEADLGARGTSVTAASAEEMDGAWNAVKAREASTGEGRR